MSQSVAVTPQNTSSRTAALAGGLVASAAVIVLGNVNVHPGEQGGLVPAVVCSVLCIAVAALLFGVVLPRVTHPVRTTVILGVLAVLSLLVFWSGVTPLFAAAVLAVPTSERPRRTVAVWRVVSVLAAALVLGWSVAEQFLHH